MKNIIRENISKLEDLPNVGKAIARDLKRIGITEPDQLEGRDPFLMYDQLCEKMGKKQYPCVLDVFMSIVSFMEGGPVLPWWEFTSERKKLMQLSH